jgi:hypothetical protein
MMEKSMPFDHRPDPVLGAALRQALGADDHGSFVARVMAALAVPRALHWDVLASWAGAGIAAAGVATLATGLLVNAIRAPAPMDLVASTAGPSAQEVVTALGPPDPGVLLVWVEEP